MFNIMMQVSIVDRWTVLYDTFSKLNEEAEFNWNLIGFYPNRFSTSDIRARSAAIPEILLERCLLSYVGRSLSRRGGHMNTNWAWGTCQHKIIPIKLQTPSFVCKNSFLSLRFRHPYAYQSPLFILYKVFLCIYCKYIAIIET